MSRPVPDRLAEDMKAAMRYKPSANSLDRIFDDSVERAMFDDILSSNRRPGSAADSRQEGFDFNNALIKRLRTAEQDIFNLQKEHARLKHYTAQLQAENDELKRNRAKGGHNGDRDVELVRENKSLRIQIEEMETFLADYGLAWNGYDHRKHCEGEWTHVEPGSTSKRALISPSKAFKKFAEKVEELNSMIRAEPTQIVTNGGRARFIHAAENVDSIKVTYYRNGLMVKRGPFRYDGSDSYKSFVRDIMDGFFPSELQSDNPDGVIIDLKDKSHVDYIEGQENDEKMTGFQLLKRLPKQIVKNGEIVEIADAIAEKLGHGKSQGNSLGVQHAKGFIEPIEKNANAESLSRSKELVHLRYEGHTASKAKTPSKRETPSSTLPTSLKNSSSPLNTSLFGEKDNTESRKTSTKDETSAVVQVKCGNGGPTFVLKMPESSLIFELREMIIDYFVKESFDETMVPQVELRSAFPPRVLTDELSMASAGLVPNGTIHAKLLN